MGVPAFFRWLVEKYPHITIHAQEEIPKVLTQDNNNNNNEEDNDERHNRKEVVIPLDLTKPNPNGKEFDNLYLDMNGIIHPCCHPEGEEAPATEELMIEAIFEYVDRVFAVVRPRKLLYLAIDGPAPRAKQNQQRSRRFRSAKEARDNDLIEESLRRELIEKGIIPPPKKSHWDSNVITPGTKFMDKVARGLRYYVHHRMNNDPAWKNIKVILSDASVPGEGEHKIMQFIRSQRAQPGYNPNTRHVLHGLDADLIMLALATHEYEFYILREQLFAKSMPQEGEVKRKLTLKEKYESKPFQFLNILILREYLEREFSDLRNTLPFPFDLERIIDDFVFMCFFVGNDFLPHLPSLDIRDGAIDLLFTLYRRTLPSMGGWMTSNGDVNLKRVQILLRRLGEVEDRIFINRLEEQRRREMIKRRREMDESQRQELQKNEKLNATPLGRRTDALSRKRKAHELEKSEEENKVAAKRLKRSLLIPSNESAPSPAVAVVAAAAAVTTTTMDRKPAETIPKPTEITTKIKETETVSITTDAKEEEEDDEDDDQAIEEGTVASFEQKYEKVQEGRKMDQKETSEFLNRLKKVISDSRIVDEEKYPDLVLFGEQGWKARYYQSKFNIEPGSPQQEHIALSYLEGLVWVFRYYYRGCTSWNWFYPYHYAPFASDLGQVKISEVKLELGEPYKPFNQLMSVLPPDSAHALPTAYAELMTSANSMIADFYPTNFKIDLNGKKQSWMGVALLPFIDEKRLLDAISTVEHTLTEEERARNTLSKDILYVHSSLDSLAPQLMEVVLQMKNSITLSIESGIAGTIEYYPDNCPADETYPIPWKSDSLEPVTDNNVISVYFIPPKVTENMIITSLLPGFKRIEPILPKLDQQYGYLDSGRSNRTLEKLLRDIEYDQQQRDQFHRRDEYYPSDRSMQQRSPYLIPSSQYIPSGRHPFVSTAPASMPHDTPGGNRQAHPYMNPSRHPISEQYPPVQRDAHGYYPQQHHFQQQQQHYYNHPPNQPYSYAAPPGATNPYRRSVHQPQPPYLPQQLSHYPYSSSQQKQQNIPLQQQQQHYPPQQYYPNPPRKSSPKSVAPNASSIPRATNPPYKHPQQSNQEDDANI
jgi:5'-3' exoribonuclease 2